MSGKKLVGKRQIQKKAQISVNNSVQNISDDDFLEEGTSHDLAAVLFFSPNTSSSRAFLSDESVTSSSINNYAMDFTNVVLTPTRMAEIFSDCIDSSLSESNQDPDSDCIDSSLSESNQELDIEPLVVRLRRWYCSSRVNLTQLKMLLTELKPDHPDLPSDPRCIVQTPVYLDIDINIDGLPVSKSSSVDVWPILGRCIGLYDQRPFVIGLFCGSGKPEPLDSYLTDFIDELKALQNDGIKYSNQVFRVFVHCFICDAPARAYLKCIKSHTGYNGCERYIQDGEHDGVKVCYDKKDKLRKNISTVVKKQEVRAELASASRLKKRLSLQEYDTNMKLNKSSKHIFTEMSRKSVKAPSASPSKQSTSCREAREKSPVIAPLTHQKARTYSITPPLSSKRILDQNSRAHTSSKHSTSCHEAREKSPLDQNCRAHTASPLLLEQNNVIADTHMSASQSPVPSQSVSDLNVDVSTPSLTHSNITDSSMSEFDIEDSNVGNSQRNKHGDECAHSRSSDNNYTDSDHDNQVVAPKKVIGMDMVKNLVYMVKIIKETQHNHGILLKEVVQRLRNKGIILSHPEGMPQIPLENINEAERMEECLASSAAQMEYLTKRLSTEGGTSVKGCVDRIMRKLLTRAVGSLYSYMGRRQKGNDPKLAFSPTNMCKAVKDAVLLVHPDANGRIIDKSIMDYLRYSPFRTKK